MLYNALQLNHMEKKTSEIAISLFRTMFVASNLRPYIEDYKQFLSDAGRLSFAFLEIMRRCSYRRCDFTIDWRDNSLPLFISSNLRALCAIKSISWRA